MNFQRKDHEVDQFFRKKLKDLDLGSQTHLWENISSQLEKNKKSSRILAFGWYTRLIVLFTLLSFGIILAYKTSLSNNSPKTDQKASINKAISDAELQRDAINNAEHNAAVITDEVRNNNTQVAVNENIITNKPSQNLNKRNSISNRPDRMNQNNNSTSGHAENISQLGINEKHATDNSENLISNTTVTEEAGIEGEKHELREISSYSFISSKSFSSVKTIKKANRRAKKEIMDDCFSRNYNPLSHFDMDVYYSPEVSMRTLVAKNDAAKAYTQKRAGSESFTGASSMGLRLSYISKRGLGVRTGINYCKIKERFEFFSGIDTSWTIHYDPNKKPIDTTYSYNPRVETKYNSYKFLDIPVVLTYEIDLADFVFSFNAGVGFNLSSNYTGQIYSSDLIKAMNINSTAGDKNAQSIFKSNVGISLIGSFGLNYKINRKLMLLAEPTCRYYMKSITNDNFPINQKYLQLGIVTGLRYRMY